ncbi:MAG: glycoside hydrolase family 75 protein [Verrucomicrobiia bacterium]
MASKRDEPNPAWWFHLAFLGAAYLIAAGLIVWTIFSAPAIRRFLARALQAQEEKVTEQPGEEREPLPRAFVPRKELHLSKLFNGLAYNAVVETIEGEAATLERNRRESFLAEVRLLVTVPKPVDTLEGLERVNANIATILPGLERMMDTARVSDFYHALYDLKVRRVKSQLDYLDRVETRHNFYDCDTILELVHPETRRKVLLLQSEMDVVTDGTDPDRTLKIEGISSTFQPFTSYRWPRRTKRPHPFAEDRRQRIAKIDKELTDPATPAEKKAELRKTKEQLRIEIADLERFSFLVARGDPFIVLPGFMYRERSHPFHPNLGDFAAVIHGDTIYPAIFGDTGPSFKTGEASLLICREIDERSGALRRPINDLEATYLVFPGTADEVRGPPNLPRWRKRVESLLKEIGGYQGTLHEWKNLFEEPTPTPGPTPSPARRDGAVSPSEPEPAGETSCVDRKGGSFASRPEALSRMFFPREINISL